MTNSYYRKAIVIKPPQREPYGLISVRVRFHGKFAKRMTTKFINGNHDAADLKCGDEVWVCQANDEAGLIVKHNPLIRLWVLLRY